MTLRFPAVLLALLASLVLAGCESGEERAERHYQSALGYLEEGEVEFALVDLRRVFQLDGLHRDARALYAATMRERGEAGEAYGQYLRLVEHYPDDLEGRVALAEMAFDLGDWEEVERHGGRAVRTAADAAEVAPIALALDYRAAVLEDDAEGRGEAAGRARDVLERDPEDRLARGVFVHHVLSSEDAAAGLRAFDEVLDLPADDLELHLSRLTLVTRTGDEAAIEAQLEETFALFPSEATVQQSLLGWHVRRGETEKAEALLRQVAELSPGEAGGYLTLVDFIRQHRGDAAALAELEALAEAAEGTDARARYESMAAAMIFDAGDRDGAIARLRAILGEPSEQTRDVKTMLAALLREVGDGEGARALVAEVLAEDASHVEALKMRATEAIAADRAGEATIDLRRALDQDPADPEIYTLMAAAHEREGSLDLAGERLALAVDVSGAAVPESLRYAQFLLSRDRAGSARQVLTQALRAAPGDLELTALLAGVVVREEDWGAAEGLRAELMQRDDPGARALGETLAVAVMMSRDRVEQTAAMLEQRVQDASSPIDRRDFALLALARAGAGEFAAAHSVLSDALAAYPGDREFRMLEAALDLGSGDAEAAEAKLRALLADAPGAGAPLDELLRLLLAQGREGEAAALVEAQLQAEPGSRQLRQLHGGLLAELGRVDEAVAVLEEVYAEDTSDLVVANNLASVLATHRGDDAETLERAATIGRRLRGRDVPAFQDTYGWIEFLRGNVGDAIAHLEPAAAGLPSDALVQYHLGRAYEAAGRTGEAQAQYESALELARGTEIEGLPQFQSADERLAALADPAAVPGE